MTNFPRYKVTRTQGFSLVEVALALGVVSFVMVTLIGLIPAGLTAFRQAQGNTVESQIVQSITNDLLLDNFSTISGYVSAPPVYYYDFEGSQLPNSSGSVYTATMVLSAQTTANSNSPVTFYNASAPAAAYMIVITITNSSDNTSYTLQHPHQYSVIIANNGL